jgi:hypothetical protein
MAEHINEKVKQILQQIVDGRKNIIKGCAELNGMRLVGYEFIYYDFDEYYSQLQKYLLPELYYQREKGTLEIKLKELDELKDKVIALSIELLEEIK